MKIESYKAEAKNEKPNPKKSPKETVRQRIKDVLSILMKRQLNADDQVVRYALSGYMLGTFKEVCDLSDIPDRLSKRIMEADADTKQSFNNFLEHLCYGEDGALEDTGIRVCSTCGELMVEGYYLDGDYACCRPCAVKNYMDAARRCGEEEDIDAAEKILQESLEYSERNDGDVYYTEWELAEK